MALPGVKNRKRLLVLLLVVTLIFFALIVRLGYIQLIWGRELQTKALDQWTRELPVAPKRGIIYDRNGKIMAQSASADTIAARPNQIEDAERAAALLAPILEMDKEALYKKLSDKTKSEIWIKRQVSKDVANRVRKLGIKGIVFTEECKRYYPNKNLASHVLGFTGIDGEGQEGIELYYDKYLRGIPGEIICETDARGRELPYNVSRYIPPINGYNIYLTIDQVIQYFTEKAASDAMERYKAKKVYAIVMDPDTGEILAMANRPDFDPNNPPRHLGFEKMQEYVKNFTCKDNLEPGSIFKIITAAAALEEGVVDLESTFYCPGYKIVDGEKIKCWKAGGHGNENFVQAVQNSCNPVFMELALRLGKERFYRYIKAFGFGQKTGVDISGEERGVLMPEKIVKNVDLARMGFGQAIAVTPLQMITAASAVVNGGKLMKPHLVRELRDENGRLIEEIFPQKVRQVISPETSKMMREVLESVVLKGSGKNAYIPGYRVGGKTGTAQKYGSDGKILHGKHIASFIGFAPADDPKVIVLFMVDEPQASVDFGSVIAAPYVRMILEDTLKYMGIEPSFDEENNENPKEVVVPDVTGMPLDDAVGILWKAGLGYLVEQSGTIVGDQMPKPGAKVMKNTRVILYLSSGKKEENISDEEKHTKVVVPDVIGKSVREANVVIVSAGLQLQIEGSGIAVSQEPVAGTEVEPGTKVVVKFEKPGD